MKPTQVWKAILLLLGLFILWNQDPIAHPGRNPSGVCLWFAFLLYLLAGILWLFPSWPWLPRDRRVLFLGAAFFVGLSFTTRDIQPPPEAPAEWFPAKGERIALHARARVVRRIRPGLVLADVVWTGTEHFSFRVKRRRFPAYLVPSQRGDVFPVALQTPIYESPPTGCELTLRLTAKSFPRRLEGSDYLESLRRSGASSLIRLRPWNIVERRCNPDLRERIIEQVIAAIRSGGYPVSYPELLRVSSGDSNDEEGEVTPAPAGQGGDEGPALRHLRNPALGIALGMVLGQAGYMDRETKKSAVSLGILHVFAASGLHLALMYGFFFWPLSRLLGTKHPLAAILPIVPAAFYLWLLDFPVSLVRAFIFVLFFAGRTLLHRPISVTDLMLNTALLTLLFFPESTLSLSALLSFGAVAGILYFLAPLERLFAPSRLSRGRQSGASHLFRRIFNGVWAFFRLQALIGLAAGLFVTPVLILFFRAYSFLSPPANLILVPLSNLLLPLIYLALGVRIFWPRGLAEHILWYGVIQGFGFMEWVMQKIEYPMLLVRFQSVGFSFAVSCLPGVCVCLILWLKHRERMRALRARLLLGGLFLLTGPLGYGLFLLAQRIAIFQ